MTNFRNTEQAVSDADLDSVEQAIKHKLPKAFREHYLRFNGGTPSLNTFPGKDGWEESVVSQFVPVGFCARNKNLHRTLLDGLYEFMRQRNVVPPNLLPFANDHGGNFFCLDLKTGAVYFFATDAFDPDLTAEANHRAAQRRLAGSFEEFLAGLVENEDGL
jgi:cell wall assembly regulator SMI1